MAGQRWRERRVQRALDLLRAEPDTVIVETRANDVVAQAREYVANGATQLVAVGGDGTVCDVAAALVGTQVPLRIVPSGTSNVLVHDLGIPRDPVEAVRALHAASPLRTLCTWRVTTTTSAHQLVLGAGIGWDASLMHALSRKHKRAYGLLAMLPVGAWRALRHRYPTLRISGVGSDGVTQEITGSSALIANVSGWAGLNAPFSEVTPTDDVLDVIVCTPRNFLHLAAFWSMVLLPGGRPLRLPGVKRLRCASLTVTAEGRVTAHAHVNGDVMAPLGLGAPTLRVEPSGTLLVRVA